MIERKLTSFDELKEKYTKFGVVLMIFNNEGKVLTVRENFGHEGTDKKVGDWGVICETSKPDELWQETAIRGLEEELGLDGTQIASDFKIDTDQNFLGECIFVDGVLARVATFIYEKKKDIFRDASKGDGEVTVIGWKTIEELLKADNLRLGVRNVLNSFVNTKDYNRGTDKPSKSLLPLTLDNLRILSK